jgi:hypothetical protein
MKREAAVPGTAVMERSTVQLLLPATQAGFTPFKEKTFYSFFLPVSFLFGQNYLEIDRTATCYY